jgi:beta-glucosidase
LTVDGDVAEVVVRNAGSRPGREVVQLYVAPEAADLDRPARWLAGFGSAEAAPGEAVTVRIPLPERAFQVWDGGWKTVPGRYSIEAAHSLSDLRLAQPVTR